MPKGRRRGRRGSGSGKNRETPLANNIFLPEPLYRRDRRGIKVARPDIILSEDELSLEAMSDFIFAEIGGQEILDISRSDFINSPLNQQYSATPGTGTSYIQTDPIVFSDGIKNTFASFAMLLETYIPEDTTLNILELDNATGTITIKLVNLRDGDNVEVEFLPYASVADDIIFEGI
jgi:hypothetical protein